MRELRIVVYIIVSIESIVCFNYHKSDNNVISRNQNAFSTNPTTGIGHITQEMRVRMFLIPDVSTVRNLSIYPYS